MQLYLYIDEICAVSWHVIGYGMSVGDRRDDGLRFHTGGIKGGVLVQTIPAENLTASILHPAVADADSKILSMGIRIHHTHKNPGIICGDVGRRKHSGAKSLAHVALANQASVDVCFRLSTGHLNLYIIQATRLQDERSLAQSVGLTAYVLLEDHQAL